MVKEHLWVQGRGLLGYFRVSPHALWNAGPLNALRTPGRSPEQQRDGSAILGTPQSTIWTLKESILGADYSSGRWLIRRQPEASELCGKEARAISSTKALKQAGTLTRQKETG